MLTKVAPQKVVNSELNYKVQVANRHSVEYIEPFRSTRVEVDFGATVGVYQESLSEWTSGDDNEAMSKPDKTLVLARIVEALQFMGSKTEIC